MAEDLMRYDLLAQEALKGVVRQALRRVERDGLPGEHHFYIAFSTRHPGVKISERLLSRYDQEMTIVLQHQFWGLHVHENGFEVELSFNDIPEKLVIPFSAVKGFFDPTVQFGLQFEVVAAAEAEIVAPVVTPGAAPASAASEAQNMGATPAAAEAAEDAGDKPKVVSLDAFRKK